VFSIENILILLQIERSNLILSKKQGNVQFNKEKEKIVGINMNFRNFVEKYQNEKNIKISILWMIYIQTKTAVFPLNKLNFYLQCRHKKINI
jgi:hypothetical protein